MGHIGLETDVLENADTDNMKTSCDIRVKRKDL